MTYQRIRFRDTNTHTHVGLWGVGGGALCIICPRKKLFKVSMQLERQTQSVARLFTLNSLSRCAALLLVIVEMRLYWQSSLSNQLFF